jgi:RNA polymerase sigma-70 factor (ECF subfamily)
MRDNANLTPPLCKGVDVEIGENLGFDALYAEVGPRLWRAVLAYTGGRLDLADDVVAEAFARTLERGSAVRRREAYVYRVAFRLAAAELRRSPTVDRIPEVFVWDDPGLVELFHAFRHLSPGQRAAVYLRYEADLPVDQVARLMGTSSGAVRIHLLRARRKLAVLLGGDDDV